MEEGVVTDIADEVIKFAHAQGHTKASRETINWSGLKTRSGKPIFLQRYLHKENKVVTGKDGFFQDLLQHVQIDHQNFNKFDDDVVTAVEYEKSVHKTDKEGDWWCANDVSIQENCLINTTDDKHSCHLTLKQGMCNSAEAAVRLIHTIDGPKDCSSRVNGLRLQSSVTKQAETKITGKIKQQSTQLARVPLTTKFRTWLNLPGNKTKKIAIPRPEQHKIVAQIPPGVKIPIEIIQHKEEERGTFTTDYYLWGHVTVTVWGKPFVMQMTDILDPKKNPTFIRETMDANERSLNSLGSAVHEKMQVTKFQLQGVYDSTKITYKIKLKVPNCMLTTPLCDVESLRCTCDTTELPDWDSISTLLCLTDKNLAKIILRWRQILFSFRHKKMTSENEWLWKALLKSNTQLADIAAQRNIEQLCRTSTPIDKFLYTLMTWRDNQLNWKDIDADTPRQECTARLVMQLYEVGMPVPVLCFLWSDENKTESKYFCGNPYQCPVHQFKPGFVPKLNDMQMHLHAKMKAQLPDRVLARLLQRWDSQDGWLSAALYLGTTSANIKSITDCNEQFPTITDKRMTVFKLWRMQHRRDSIAQNSSSQMPDGLCTVYNLCEALSEMGLSQTVYSFLWTDSETTP